MYTSFLNFQQLTIFNNPPQFYCEFLSIVKAKTRSLITMSGIVAASSETLQVLQAYKGEDTPSTRMFVLSDGQETVEPWVAAALPTIESLGITVDTIAYR